MNIEKTFLKYSDTATVTQINPETDKEALVKIPGEFLDGRCQNPYLRETVLKKLAMANEYLKRIRPNCRLIVLDAFRPMDIQIKAYNEAQARLGTTDPEICHRQVAVPSVSGHPTGGAVDVIIDGLDFGTGYCDWDAGTKLYYASPDISRVAKRNRKLLRKIMLKQGFVQYMAEWWHFNYGDKEWAFANNTVALYNQLS